jgi:hypothetical protein
VRCLEPAALSSEVIPPGFMCAIARSSANLPKTKLVAAASSMFIAPPVVDSTVPGLRLRPNILLLGKQRTRLLRSTAEPETDKRQSSDSRFYARKHRHQHREFSPFQIPVAQHLIRPRNMAAPALKGVGFGYLEHAAAAVVAPRPRPLPVRSAIHYPMRYRKLPKLFGAPSFLNSEQPLFLLLFARRCFEPPN